MFVKTWSFLLSPAILVGVVLSGCGTASVQSTNTMNSGSANTMGSGSTTSPTGSAHPIFTGDILVGAAASPPTGNGNGTLLLKSVRMPKTVKVALASNANAFRIGIDGNTAYIPTLQGKTYVVDLRSRQVVSSFSTPQGARIANVSKANHLLLITGASSVTAYSLPGLKQVWQVSTGGNALSLAGNVAYLSSNSSSNTSMIDLKTGKLTGAIGVGHIEDSVYDKEHHTLWLANWTTGDMTVVNTMDKKVLAVVHKAEGGGFSMANMMSSQGGFMQLAVGPHGNHVYAASFSGNIMVYDAKNNMFEKDIPTVSGAKLSGIAIDRSGQYAYTTVESKMETIAVALKTGQVVSTYPNMESNRWYVIH